MVTEMTATGAHNAGVIGNRWRWWTAARAASNRRLSDVTSSLLNAVTRLFVISFLSFPVPSYPFSISFSLLRRKVNQIEIQIKSNPNFKSSSGIWERAVSSLSGRYLQPPDTFHGLYKHRPGRKHIFVVTSS